MGVLVAALIGQGRMLQGLIHSGRMGGEEFTVSVRWSERAVDNRMDCFELTVGVHELVVAYEANIIDG